MKKQYLVFKVFYFYILDPCLKTKCKYYSVCEALDEDKATCTCQSICSKLYKPICGTDGKTYANECQMKSSSCKQKKTIDVLQQGSCGKNLFHFELSFLSYSKINLFFNVCIVHRLFANSINLTEILIK